MALHLTVVAVLVILVCADTDTVIWAAGFRIPATSAQHDYSTKSEGITVDEVLVMASAHLLSGDMVWHGTDSKTWTCTWNHLHTGHLTLRDSLRKPDVGVIMNTHQQVCALQGLNSRGCPGNHTTGGAEIATAKQYGFLLPHKFRILFLLRLQLKSPLSMDRQWHDFQNFYFQHWTKTFLICARIQSIRKYGFWSVAISTPPVVGNQLSII